MRLSETPEHILPFDVSCSTPVSARSSGSHSHVEPSAAVGQGGAAAEAAGAAAAMNAAGGAACGSGDDGSVPGSRTDGPFKIQALMQLDLPLGSADDDNDDDKDSIDLKGRLPSSGTQNPAMGYGELMCDLYKYLVHYALASLWPKVSAAWNIGKIFQGLLCSCPV